MPQTKFPKLAVDDLWVHERMKIYSAQSTVKKVASAGPQTAYLIIAASDGVHDRILLVGIFSNSAGRPIQGQV